MALDGVERTEEAVATLQESIGAYRRVADADPDTWNPEVANALVALARVLAGAKRYPEAVPLAAEAAELYAKAALSFSDLFDDAHEETIALTEHLRAHLDDG